jgi:hypothetical protein
MPMMALLNPIIVLPTYRKQLGGYLPQFCISKRQHPGFLGLPESGRFE